MFNACSAVKIRNITVLTFRSVVPVLTVDALLLLVSSVTPIMPMIRAAVRAARKT